MESKLIEQPLNSNKCGHACLSMVTGHSMETISERLQSHKELSLEKEVMWYLNQEGFNVKMITAFEIEADDIPNNSIVRLEDQNDKGHFVLKQNDYFKDPNVGVVKSYIKRKRITHYLIIK